MDLDAQAYKLLQGQAADAPVEVTLDELRKRDNRDVIAGGTLAFGTLVDRTERYQPDCEYLAELELANGYVIILQSMGIVTPEFAAKFADAVDYNVRTAMTKMTAEERENELVMREEQYMYAVPPSDDDAASKRLYDVVDSIFVSPNKKPRAPSRSEEDARDGATKLVLDAPDQVPLGMEAEDPDLTRVPRYDRGEGVYEGLTKLGRWVTSNDENDLILGWDRFKAFSRFITGSTTAMTATAVGTLVVVASLDFLPWQARAVLLGASGVVLGIAGRRTRSAMNLQTGGVTGGLISVLTIPMVAIGPSLKDFIDALLVACTPVTPSGWLDVRGWIVQGMEWAAYHFPDKLAWIFGLNNGEVGRAEVRLLNAAWTHVHRVLEVLKHPWLLALIKGLVAWKQTLSLVAIAGGFYYYFGLHYAHRYVPGRQKHYLALNSVKAFSDAEKKARKKLKRAGDLIAQVKPTVGAAGAMMRRMIAQDQQALERRKAGISTRLGDITSDREDLVIGPVAAADVWRRNHPGLQRRRGRNDPSCPARSPRGQAVNAGDPDYEKACCDVDALIQRFSAVEAQIDQLRVDAQQKLAQYNIQIASCAGGEISVVDEVFAKLHL